MECGQASILFQEKTLDVIKKTETERCIPELWKPRIATTLQQLVHDHSPRQKPVPGVEMGITENHSPDSLIMPCAHKHINQSNLNPGEWVKDARLLTFMWEGRFDEWLCKVSVLIGYLCHSRGTEKDACMCASLGFKLTLGLIWKLKVTGRDLTFKRSVWDTPFASLLQTN